MKYVYCLASEVGALDALPSGLGGAAVQPLCCGKITALVSEMASGPLAGTSQQALIHQEVVQSALTSCTSILPCRFGTRFRDEREILALLEKHHTLLETRLSQLSGKIEVGVRVLFRETLSEAVQPIKSEGLAEGVRYLLEKSRRRQALGGVSRRAEKIGQELSQATALLWTEVKEQKRRIPQGLLLSLCYLMARENVHRFKGAYDSIQRRWPGVEMLYTGPWPPYSFSDINLSRAHDIPISTLNSEDS